MHLINYIHSSFYKLLSSKIFVLTKRIYQINFKKMLMNIEAGSFISITCYFLYC